MKTIRLALVLVTMALLVAGYLASLFSGDPSGYAQKVDSPAVSLLALVLVFGLVVSGVMALREKEDDAA